MTDLPELVDLYDRVAADAASHLAPELASVIAAIGRQVRERRTMTDRLFLVGLLGGTGSGKSSLLNALAGAEVSASGAVRPTTARPRAWVPRGRGSEVNAALASLGLEEVVEHDLDARLAILDLPDVDSVNAAHRLWVESVLPFLDLAVWVVDPEKYRDRVLHVEILRPLVIHQATFRFVLNQIDRVEEGDRHPLQTDLSQALANDGIANPVVWPAAADPPIGPPLGIEAIWDGIRAASAAGMNRSQNLVDELKRGAELLAASLGTADFTPRWDDLRQIVGRHLEAGDRRRAREILIGFVESLGLDSAIDFEEALTAASVSADPARSLDLGLGRQLRNQLRPRARTRALLAEFQLALARAGESP